MFIGWYLHRYHPNNTVSVANSHRVDPVTTVNLSQGSELTTIGRYRVRAVPIVGLACIAIHLLSDCSECSGSTEEDTLLGKHFFRKWLFRKWLLSEVTFFGNHFCPFGLSLSLGTTRSYMYFWIRNHFRKWLSSGPPDPNCCGSGIFSKFGRDFFPALLFQFCLGFVASNTWLAHRVFYILAWTFNHRLAIVDSAK